MKTQSLYIFPTTKIILFPIYIYLYIYQCLPFCTRFKIYIIYVIFIQLVAQDTEQVSFFSLSFDEKNKNKNLTWIASDMCSFRWLHFDTHEIFCDFSYYTGVRIFLRNFLRILVLEGWTNFFRIIQQKWSGISKENKKERLQI